MIRGLLWFFRAIRSSDPAKRFDGLLFLGKKILPHVSSEDELVRFDMLMRMGQWLVPRYRFKWPQMDWWDDEQFTRYLAQFNELSLPNADRRWMLGQLMRLTSAIPGDTAECGVFQGAGSYLMCKANESSAFPERTHHAFDSFEGLSQPSIEDGSFWTRGDLSATVEATAANLAEFRHLEIHKGWIPEVLAVADERSFSFVHIDVDLYSPTIESLRFFYPRMSPGGIILCDDYGFSSCPGATRAVDEFLAGKEESMLALSCGGGFLIKGRPTA